MNIVFDIGGTNMRVARAEGRTLGEIKKVPTPADPKDGVATFISLVRELSGDAKITSITGCIGGEITSEGELYRVFPEGGLAKWAGTKFPRVVSDGLDTPVHIANDAALAGLGEYYDGAGQGSKILVYMTVSSGVGACRIIEGKMDKGVFGFHVGRQLISGVELERQVSGTAVRKKFGHHPKELESEEERNKLADILAIGLYNTAVHWSPDLFVLGGSMITGVNPIPLPRVGASLVKLFEVLEIPAPAVKMASLGDSGGLHGAAILASQK